MRDWPTPLTAIGDKATNDAQQRCDAEPVVDLTTAPPPPPMPAPAPTPAMANAAPAPPPPSAPAAPPAPPAGFELFKPFGDEG